MQNPVEFKVHYDADADLAKIKAHKVAVIGFGSQGHAHAQNLKDSGVDVVMGLREGSPSRAKAAACGLQLATPAEAAAQADVVMMLIPDEVAAEVYQEEIAPVLRPGSYLAFAHGFNVHFGKIVPPDNVGLFLVAPKGPGHMVRRQYSAGSGVPCLVATGKPGDSETLALALSYAKAIGGTRAGVFETTFREETETDLFGEQAVLCGGLSSLVKAGFDTLVENGYSPVMAYFECVHELKLIVDLIYEGGLAHMRRSISNTAEFGDYLVGSEVVDVGTRARMQAALERVRSGAFAETWLAEHRSGGQRFTAMREAAASHPLEQYGQALRARMLFPKKD